MTYTLSDPDIRNKNGYTFLAGMFRPMTINRNSTTELWRDFMSRRGEIPPVRPDLLWSVQFYPPGYFRRFDPDTEFERWAAQEIEGPESLPAGIDLLVVPPGLYAVFSFCGSIAAASEVFGHIYSNWLPSSPFDIDDRPHFELLGPKFDRDSDTSEEEIWIPVRINV